MLLIKMTSLLFGVLASAIGLDLPPQQPNLSGEWVFMSGTTDSARGGTPGERPTKAHTTSGAAFNCGRECRIVQAGSSLTIEDARFDGHDGSTIPAVKLQLDGKPHMVVDSFNPGNTIEAISRWNDGKLLVDGTAWGALFKQSVWLERDELVVATSSVVAGWTTKIRYERKRPARP